MRCVCGLGLGRDRTIEVPLVKRGFKCLPSVQARGEGRARRKAERGTDLPRVALRHTGSSWLDSEEIRLRSAFSKHINRASWKFWEALGSVYLCHATQTQA